MSDSPQGPGWFQAQDGKWYPPAPQQAQAKKGGCFRWIGIAVVAFIALIIVAVVLVSVGSKSSNNNKVGGGTSSHPASADVAISSCEVTSAPFVSAKGTITNHSSGKSNYIVNVEFVNSAGTRVASSAAAENDVAAGQQANFEAVGSASGDTAGLTCKVTDVTRLAAP